MPSSSPIASVILPTRNRKELLRQAITTSFGQSVPVEVIVADDGSTDGTEQMVRSEFPQVKYLRFDGPKGPAFLRNRGAEAAGTEMLFPIDDDAVFTSKETVRQTIAEFAEPRIGAVGIPYINTRTNQVIRQRAPDDREIYLTSAFVGASHAVRRQAFLHSGGYREHLFYMGEEGDLCLRMLQHGWVTRLGNADAITHYESPIRNSKWADLYGRRNDVLCTWHNVPLASLPGRLMGVTFNGVMHGARKSRLLRMLRGLAWGYGSILTHLTQRQPVSAETYRLFRRLSREMLPLCEISPLLPAVPAPDSDLVNR